MIHLAVRASLLMIALLPGACREPASTLMGAAAPLKLTGPAYELAGQTLLSDAPTQELLGLHHVLPLSQNIISGAEPDGEEGLASIAALGVRTILSVDGKTPDAAAAARHGLRYVHVPIQYKGMTEDELLSIAKTFRELPGPFYVHCFHGQHRGPAAAAVGRLILDGATRELALAEMRQWCGTSSKYDGLYDLIAAGELPDVDATTEHIFDFPASRELAETRALMVSLSRAFDNLEGMAKNGWQVNPEHPDVDPVNEAAILVDLLTQAALVPQPDHVDAGYSAFFGDTLDRARDLHVTASRAGTLDTSPDWTETARSFDSLSRSCSTCHVAYRN